MGNISKETAQSIAYACLEIDAAQGLLDKVKEALERRSQPDIRDAFGRQRGGLQLGVPSGTIYDLPWSMCAPILEAYVANRKMAVALLTEKASAEMSGLVFATPVAAPDGEGA